MNNRIPSRLKIFFSLIASLIALLSTLLIIVDSVALIFTYLSLIPLLLSLDSSIKFKQNRLLQLYTLLFLLAHLTVVWRTYSDATRQYTSHNSQQHPPYPTPTYRV